MASTNQGFLIRDLGQIPNDLFGCHPMPHATLKRAPVILKRTTAMARDFSSQKASDKHIYVSVKNGSNRRPSESTQEALNSLLTQWLGCLEPFSTISTKIPPRGTDAGTPPLTPLGQWLVMPLTDWRRFWCVKALHSVDSSLPNLPTDSSPTTSPPPP